MTRKKEKCVIVDLSMTVRDPSCGDYEMEGPIVTMYEHGVITFSEKGMGESHIYLYPEQVELLKTVMGLGDKIKVEEREV